jgi:two-component system, cell cycle sensor histidine kinase and response regulator CckA
MVKAMPRTTNDTHFAFLDSVAAPIVRLDPQGRFTYLNAAAVQALGAAGQPLVGHPPTNGHLPRDTALAIEAGVRSVLATKKPVDCMIAPLHTHASSLRLRLVPELGANQSVAAVVGLGIDEAGLQSAQHDLHHSEAVYRLLIEGVTDYAIFMIDPTGHITSWNPGAEHIKGYTAAEVLGKHFSIFYPPEDTACGKAEHELTHALAHGRFEEEGWRVRKDGSRFWANVILAPIRDALGVLVGFSKVTRDLTQRRATEIALRESEQRYRFVVENQTEVVCRFLACGTFTFCNEVYCRTFGKTQEELLGQKWQPVTHPDDVPHIRSQLALLSVDHPVVHIENRVYAGNGDLRWMEFVNRGFFDADGKLVEVQAVGRDVTARRAAEDARRELEASLLATQQQRKYEKQLQQSQKLESLGVLAGGIAHDFNNLLTAMLGHASLARMRMAENDPAIEDMKHIEATAMRAAELCQQMLAYAGRGQFLVKAISLNLLTEEMSQLLATVLSKRAVLKYNLMEDLPLVEADATQLRQVVMNLITNASDAIAARSGVITLTTGVIEADARYLAEIHATNNLKPGPFVYLEVSDTGCGMTDEVRQKIFDPFFSTKFTGRGLGLAAVQGIIRAHHGAIKVYTQLGKGTTFKVMLPALGVPTEAPRAAPATMVTNGRGRHVLVVDDEEDVRVFVRKVLEMAGFAVTVSPDGKQGVQAFAGARQPFALVLLDLTMPKLSGIEAYREIRRVQNDAKVVLMSGFAEEEATSGFAGKGLAGFLRKPFRTDELLRIAFEAASP